MSGGIGVNPDYDYLLDPQMTRPVGFCENCGGEVYTPGERLCGECEGRKQ